jgi:hypothetical protein
VLHKPGAQGNHRSHTGTSSLRIFSNVPAPSEMIVSFNLGSTTLRRCQRSIHEAGHLFPHLLQCARCLVVAGYALEVGQRLSGVQEVDDAGCLGELAALDGCLNGLQRATRLCGV